MIDEVINVANLTAKIHLLRTLLGTALGVGIATCICILYYSGLFSSVIKKLSFISKPISGISKPISDLLSWRKRDIKYFRRNITNWIDALVEADYPGDIIKHIQMLWLSYIVDRVYKLNDIDTGLKSGCTDPDHANRLQAVLNEVVARYASHFEKQIFSPHKTCRVFHLLRDNNVITNNEYALLRILHVFEDAKYLQNKTEKYITHAFFFYLSPSTKTHENDIHVMLDNGEIIEKAKSSPSINPVLNIDLDISA